MITIKLEFWDMRFHAVWILTCSCFLFFRLSLCLCFSCLGFCNSMCSTIRDYGGRSSYSSRHPSHVLCRCFAPFSPLLLDLSIFFRCSFSVPSLSLPSLYVSFSGFFPALPWWISRPFCSFLGLCRVHLSHCVQCHNVCLRSISPA